ncbi:STAS domain-containing protein, partial [Mesorhizobium sp. M8A.F.Ca.ET.021.01.1.1]
MLTIGKRDASGTTASGADHDPRVAVGEEGGVLGCAFSGVWTTRTVALIDAEMRKIEKRSGFKTLALDLSKIEKIDTAGAWLIDRLVSVFEKKNVEVRLQGQSDVASILLEAVGEAVRREPESGPARPPNIVIRALEAVGRRVYEMRDDFLASMNILGATIRGAQMKLGR